jgi:ribosomal protein L32
MRNKSKTECHKNPLPFIKKIWQSNPALFLLMAVPKKKIARSYGKVRYSHYEKEEQKRIQNKTKIVLCDSCGAPKLSHCVCKECGKSNGRQVLQKTEKAETTRVQA